MFGRLGGLTEFFTEGIFSLWRVYLDIENGLSLSFLHVCSVKHCAATPTIFPSFSQQLNEIKVSFSHFKKKSRLRNGNSLKTHNE
jgi:hypothetical protein